MKIIKFEYFLTKKVRSFRVTQRNLLAGRQNFRIFASEYSTLLRYMVAPPHLPQQTDSNTPATTIIALDDITT